MGFPGGSPVGSTGESVAVHGRQSADENVAVANMERRTAADVVDPDELALGQ